MIDAIAALAIMAGLSLLVSAGVHWLLGGL